MTNNFSYNYNIYNTLLLSILKEKNYTNISKVLYKNKLELSKFSQVVCIVIVLSLLTIWGDSYV